MPKSPRNDVDAHIGKRIRMRRMQLNLSQEAVAEQIGVTFQQLQKYEKGVNGARGSRLVQIADALKVSPGFFFEGAHASAHDAPADPVQAMLSDLHGAEVARDFMALSSGGRALLRAMANKIVAFEAAEQARRKDAA